MNRLAARLALLLACILPAAPTLAQSFPSQPVRIIIPFPPGGSNDVLARMIAPRLSEALGQPVLVENRPGGNTVIASQALLAGDRNGHTLLLPGNSHVLVPHLSKQPLPFHSLDDFQPVASLARTGLMLVVHPQSPATSLAQFIAQAKAQPGKLNSAAPGGSINQLATELFNSTAGVQLVHVAYKGAAPAAADLMAGHVQASFQTPATVIGNVRAGQLRALAISGDTPFADPPVPTFAQAGLPGFDVGLSFGLLAPAGTPRAAVDRLNAEIGRIIATQAFRDGAAAMGLTPFASTPEQYGALLKADHEKFGVVVKAAGILPQ